MGFAKKIPGATGFLRFVGKTSGVRALVGDKQFGAMDLAGQAAGVYDDRYKVKPIDPIPTGDTTQSTVNAADIARRLAKAAAGRDSTIRTSPAGALYPSSGTGKSLLGS